MKLFAFCALTALLVAAPAVAEDTRMRVRLQGLDTNSDAGASEAVTRITKSAQKACSVQSTGSRITRRDEACEADMARRAVDSLGSQKVAELYRGVEQARLAKTQPQG